MTDIPKPENHHKGKQREKTDVQNEWMGRPTNSAKY